MNACVDSTLAVDAKERLRQLLGAVAVLGDEALLESNKEDSRENHGNQKTTVFGKGTKRSITDCIKLDVARKEARCKKPRRSGSGESSETRQPLRKAPLPTLSHAFLKHMNVCSPSLGMLPASSAPTRRLATIQPGKHSPAPSYSERNNTLSDDTILDEDNNNSNIAMHNEGIQHKRSTRIRVPSTRALSSIEWTAPKPPRDMSVPTEPPPEATLSVPRLSSTNSGPDPGSALIEAMVSLLKGSILHELDDYARTAEAGLELKAQVATGFNSEISLKELSEKLEPAIAAVTEARHFSAHLTSRDESEPWLLVRVLRQDLLPAPCCSEADAELLAAQALYRSNSDPLLALVSLLCHVNAHDTPTNSDDAQEADQAVEAKSMPA